MKQEAFEKIHEVEEHHEENDSEKQKKGGEIAFEKSSSVSEISNSKLSARASVSVSRSKFATSGMAASRQEQNPSKVSKHTQPPSSFKIHTYEVQRKNEQPRAPIPQSDHEIEQ